MDAVIGRASAQWARTVNALARNPAPHSFASPRSSIDDEPLGHDNRPPSVSWFGGIRVQISNPRTPTTWRSMRLANVRRAILIVGAVVVALLLLMGISGYFMYTNASADGLQRANAIVVLGGEHDGREDYAIDLARDGWAPTVVLSNPYPADDPVMQRVCTGQAGAIEVLCKRPDPVTTRGEAEMIHRLAAERSWRKIVVVTWRYHMPRARSIFGQCFSRDPNAVVMQAVPRQYDFSVGHWEFVYAYQDFAWVKAFIQGDCD
jgi:hypothetical protein